VKSGGWASVSRDEAPNAPPYLLELIHDLVSLCPDDRPSSARVVLERLDAKDLYRPSDANTEAISRASTGIVARSPLGLRIWGFLAAVCVLIFGWMTVWTLSGPSSVVKEGALDLSVEHCVGCCSLELFVRGKRSFRAEVFLRERDGDWSTSQKIGASTLSTRVVFTGLVSGQHYDGSIVAMYSSGSMAKTTFDAKTIRLTAKAVAELPTLPSADFLARPFAGALQLGDTVLYSGAPFGLVQLDMRPPFALQTICRLAPSGPVFLSDSRCFVCEKKGSVAAIEFPSGEMAWSKRFSSRIDPLLFFGDGNVYIRSSVEGVLCLDALTGKRKWCLEGCYMTWPWLVTDGIGLVNGTPLSLRFFDARGGKYLPLTKFNHKALFLTAAAYCDGNFYLGVGGKGFMVGHPRGDPLFKVDTPGEADDIVVTARKIIIATHDAYTVTALDRESGAVSWRRDAEPKRGHTKIFVFGQLLVLLDNAGVAFHELSSGRLLGRLDMEYVRFFGVLRVESTLYVASWERLYAIELGPLDT